MATDIQQVEQEQSNTKSAKISSKEDTDAQNAYDNDGVEHVANNSEPDVWLLESLDEDLHNGNAHFTGFVGRSSDIQWLRTVEIVQANSNYHGDHASSHQRKGSFVSNNYESVSAFSYWNDGEKNSMETFIDMYGLPSTETAERLVQCYMLKVHDSFPILPRRNFGDQFRVYISAVRNRKPPPLNLKWQCMLNLIFAIGARYFDLTKAFRRTEECSHRIYQERATALCLDEASTAGHSDLLQIRIHGLLAFYWLSTGQVTR